MMHVPADDFDILSKTKINLMTKSSFYLSEETHLSDNAASPVIGNRSAVTSSTLPTKTASHPASPSSTTTDPWPAQSDEDIDRLVAMHQNRHNSLSSLGVSYDSLKVIEGQ